MAAPTKQGLGYFPLDIDLDQDDKLGMIIGEFGEKGERLYIKMLGWTYKNEGYFFDWKEDVQLRFLHRYNYCGFTMEYLQQVTARCLKWGLFDQQLFSTYHVLTSKRVQKTWLEASRKRIGRVVIKNYWLVNIPAAEKNPPQWTEITSGIMAEETRFPAPVMDKVKESKGNEKKLSPAKKSPGMDLDFTVNLVTEKFNAEFVTDWMRWKGYKAKEHKFHYKSEDSETAALEKLVRLSGGSAVTAGAIIKESMANGWEGLFELKQDAGSAPAAAGGGKATLTDDQLRDTVAAGKAFKMQKEINYLFDTFCDGHCTVLSIQTAHYDFLKNNGQIDFTAAEKEKIKLQAQQHISDKKIEVAQNTELNFMKKFGVLAYFEKNKDTWQEAGKQ